jgi:hypothetical protein
MSASEGSVRLRLGVAIAGSALLLGVLSDLLLRTEPWEVNLTACTVARPWAGAASCEPPPRTSP